MSILESLFYFIFVLFIGCLVVRVGWKLKYLAPLCFFSVSSLVFSIFYFFAKGSQHVVVFVNGHFLPNASAYDALIGAAALGGIVTFLLVVVVLAIRNDVF